MKCHVLLLHLTVISAAFISFGYCADEDPAKTGEEADTVNKEGQDDQEAEIYNLSERGLAPGAMGVKMMILPVEESGEDSSETEHEVQEEIVMALHESRATSPAFPPQTTVAQSLEDYESQLGHSEKNESTDGKKAVLFTDGRTSMSDLKESGEFEGYEIKHAKSTRSQEVVGSSQEKNPTSTLGLDLEEDVTRTERAVYKNKDAAPAAGGNKQYPPKDSKPKYTASTAKKPMKAIYEATPAVPYTEKTEEKAKPTDSYQPPAPGENKEVVCKGINTKKTLKCDTTENRCALKVLDIKRCYSMSNDCILLPACVQKTQVCNKCTVTQVCAWQSVKCLGKLCRGKSPACIAYLIGGQVTTHNDDVSPEEQYTACKISGSKKVAKCKTGQVCSPVLPHGKKCYPRGKGDCTLEPRCLTKKESKLCENDLDCRINRKACLLVEECDYNDPYKCAVWPRCFDLGIYGLKDEDYNRVDPYFKYCKIKGNPKKALCLKDEKCVKAVKDTDPCLRGEACYCSQYEASCLAKGSRSCDEMKCKKKCVYLQTTGCNQFLLGPCCPAKRKPYYLTCPASSYCLIDYIKSNMPVTYDKDPKVPSTICDLPADQGTTCKGVQYSYGSIRWSFSYEYGCQPFVYRGCGGNKNNFKKEVDCQSACLTAEKISNPSY